MYVPGDQLRANRQSSVYVLHIIILFTKQSTDSILHMSKKPACPWSCDHARTLLTWLMQCNRDLASDKLWKWSWVDHTLYCNAWAVTMVQDLLKEEKGSSSSSGIEDKLPCIVSKLLLSSIGNTGGLAGPPGTGTVMPLFCRHCWHPKLIRWGRCTMHMAHSKRHCAGHKSVSTALVNLHRQEGCYNHCWA